MKTSYLLMALLSFLVLVFTSETSAEDNLLKVSVTPLSAILVVTKNSAPANIISLNHSTISSEIVGRALKIHAEAGDNVKKGQKLVSLDCRSYILAKKQADASLKVAKTQLNLAKKQLLRNQRLVSNGTIPRELYEKTEAAKDTSVADIELKKATIDTARLAIKRCSIAAPFSGQITNRMVQKGQLVMAGTALFKLMQNDTMEIRTHLSSAVVLRLDSDQQLEFVSGELQFKAKLRSVIQSIDETTRTQEVRLTFPRSVKVAAGLSGRVEWSNKGLKIPTEYILRKDSELGIMTALDIVEGSGKVKFHPLKNAIEGQAATNNLPANTVIITKNQFRVKDGQLVQIQK